MRNIVATLRADVVLTDGVYAEREDPDAHTFEQWLQKLIAHFPDLAGKQRQMRRFVMEVNALEQALQRLTDNALVAEFWNQAPTLKKSGLSDKHLALAFAIIREASRRVLGMRHHDVQIMGGWVLVNGMVAEMETGEGKTLVATLAACAVSSTGAITHVITVNDYLAERDANSNRPLFEFLNLNCGTILQGMTPLQRREQYACNIVYVSNKEIVFDYLKDRIAIKGLTGPQMQLRRVYQDGAPVQTLLQGLHFAIVDEADSVLIDEARTPLIISETESDETGGTLYHAAIACAQKMNLGEHFLVPSPHEVWITAAGQNFIATHTSQLGGVWTSSLWQHELIQKALTALHCYKKDQHYIIAEDKIQIVDEFTGRVMPDRSWERGLHQMIEAKENCEITGQRRTLTRITFQRFFRRYLILSGMTGTAAEIKPELQFVYGLKVQRIPTNLPSKRNRLGSRCKMSADDRWTAVARRASELASQGRAVLIGTRSVHASEIVSALFSTEKIAHTVLNARQDKDEALTIAAAGEPGRITIATNMAGRGTDIRLNDDTRVRGGLHVILTEFHESARIDRQLFGRSARQGDPGSVEAIVSLDDELFRTHAPVLLRMAKLIAGNHDQLPSWTCNLLVRMAQRNAERKNRRIRSMTLRHDQQLEASLAFVGKPS